jgi:sigma-B regulation protein RsbU (phosphoserine phosphatase)
MNQRKLFRTIERLTPENFKTNEELLLHVLQEIITHEAVKITGGRLWSLSPSKKSYILVRQIGDMTQIEERYSLRVSENPIFFEIGKHRTILTNETNSYLRKKGILRYSASGVGERYKLGDKRLYQYILALNSPSLNQELIDTMNIISSAVTSTMLNRNIAEQKRWLERDIDQAREIQRSILPEHELHFGPFQLFGVSLPERIVGGDFFDYLTIGMSDDRLGVVIGDAASKGLSAAIQALYISGALKMGASFETKINTMITKVNNLIHRTFPDERFVTLFYAELFNNKKGLCLFCNAGHNSPLYYSARTNTITQLENTGPVLGLAPDQRFSTENINLQVNDVVLLYTDGITEAMNATKEMFGEEHLTEKLMEYKHLTAKDITQKILEDVQIYSAQAPFADDKTIVTIKRISE